jgi:phosphotransferase system enzyme I (PtsP)
MLEANKKHGSFKAGVLLRRLREIIAVGNWGNTDKIRKSMALLCDDLNGDVSSVYLLRGEATLELLCLSTSDLYQGQRRPKIVSTDGVMGDVIDHGHMITCNDICTHHKFSGHWADEKLPLRGFMGAPLISSGKTIGILAFQTLKVRSFTDEETEVLQTFAMLFSEMIVGDRTIQRYLHDITASSDSRPVLSGHVLSPGVSIGQAFLHHENLEASVIFTDDTAKELGILMNALQVLHSEIDALQKSIDSIDDKESTEIFEAYKMFSQDRGWLTQIEKSIEQGLTAEAAAAQAIKKIRDRVKQSKDPYFRDRLWDFEDLSSRLLRAIKQKQSSHAEISQPIILIAEHLGPADLLEYQRYDLKGIIIQEEMALAHVAILAKSLNIPVISGVKSILSLAQWGDQVIINTNKSQVHINPDAETIQKFQAKMKRQKQQMADIVRLQQLPAITKDGCCIDLMLNAGATHDMQRLNDSSISGIGLYRTEIPFMMHKNFPDVLSQEHMYKEIYNCF